MSQETGMLRFDRTIKVTDIITSGALLVSAITLGTSWRKERELRVRTEAAEVRVAAAKCIAKLDRWQALQLGLFDELQVDYVAASERFPGESKAAVRDFVYKAVRAAMARASSKIMEEQLETAYADLLSSNPAAREHFQRALTSLQSVRATAADALLASTEGAVLSLNVNPEDYQTADLGNALRLAADSARQPFLASSSRVLTDFRAPLFELMELNDDELVERRHQLPDPRQERSGDSASQPSASGK
jgi:hypothetical protein